MQLESLPLRHDRKQRPPQPSYPTSFSHIVDLITRNQPIPGIETIPDIVLGTDKAAPNTVPPRPTALTASEAAAGEIVTLPTNPARRHRPA